MGPDPNRAIKNCEECVGKHYCYGSGTIRIPREAGQANARRCRLALKGKGTQRITVRGQKRGISRKKAAALVYKGRAVWVDSNTIQKITMIQPLYEQRKEEIMTTR
jgi:hypothetical protein